MRASISKAVDERTPASAFDRPRELAAALKARTTPFRLMHLPTELRQHIIAFTCDDHLHTVIDIEDLTPIPTPPITRTSRQLRQEVLPRHYGRLDIWLQYYSLCTSTYYAARFVKQVCVWADRIGPGTIKMLRRISMETEAMSDKGGHVSMVAVFSYDKL